MNPATRKHEDNVVEAMLYMALELSNKTWRVTFGDGARRPRCRPGGEAVWVAGVHAGGELLRSGRDGFWLHRCLVSSGIDNVVVDSSSIEVNRRKRRAKTDRIDGEHLLVKLMRYHAGERGGWSALRVPSVAEEDARRLHRELERLKRERGSHQCRIQALLVAQGIRAKLDAGFGRRLETLTLWDGNALPEALKAELLREHERLKLLEGQIKALEAQRRQRLREPKSRTTGGATDALGRDRSFKRVVVRDGVPRLARVS